MLLANWMSYGTICRKSCESGSRFFNVSSRFSHLIHKVEKIALASGRPFRRFRFHDLRHLFAVSWLKAAGSLYSLQHQLGHRSISATEWYLPFLSPAEQHAVKNGVNSRIRLKLS